MASSLTNIFGNILKETPLEDLEKVKATEIPPNALAGPVLLRDIPQPSKDRLKRLEPVLEVIGDTLPDDNWILAGGAVRDTLIGLTPKDYDVFLYTGNMLTEHTPLSRRLGATSRFGYVNSVRTSLIGMDADVSVLSFRDTQTIVGLDKPFHILLAEMPSEALDGRLLQYVVSTHASTPEELLESFDMSFCKYGLTPKGEFVACEHSPSMSELDGIFRGELPLEIFKSHNQTYSLFRLLKFALKFGCDVYDSVVKVLSEWENSDIEFCSLSYDNGSYMNDQSLWDVTQAYAARLVEEQPRYRDIMDELDVLQDIPTFQGEYPPNYPW